MIDPVLITRKISLIAGDLRAAEPLARFSLEEYLRDPINEVAVERYLERLIGRMIDINYHVVTEMGHPPPKNYFESFLQMGRLSALPAEFAREIPSLAGLRNRLVHEFGDRDHFSLQSQERSRAEADRVCALWSARVLDCRPGL